MKTGEMAKRLYQSPSNIRTWADQYAEFLSERGAGIAPGAARRFNPDDQLVMATIAHLRNEGKSHDAIHETLAEGWRVEEVPGAPNAARQRAVESSSLVPASQLQVVTERALFFEEERRRLLQKSAQERAKHEELVEEIRELERKLGEAQGEIKVLRELIERQDDQEEQGRKRGPFGLW